MNRYKNVVDPATAMAVSRFASETINGTVNNLLRNKVYKAQADKIKLEGRLAQLDNAQQYELALRLQDAKNDNERFALLQEFASRIDVEAVASSGRIFEAAIDAQEKRARTTAIIIGSALVLVIGAYYVIYKKN